MSHAWAVFLHYLPLLLVTLSTLITGFSQYPQTANAARALKVILNMLSVVQHSDSPGTFKWPLRMSRIPDTTTVSQKVMAGTLVSPKALLPFLFLPLLHGCSYCQQAIHKNELKCQVSQVAQQCGEPAIAKLVTQILPQVVADLIQGNYADMLAQLVQTLQQQGISDALTAITCAVQSVSVNVLPRSGGDVPPYLATIQAHAVAWLKAQGAK